MLIQTSFKPFFFRKKQGFFIEIEANLELLSPAPCRSKVEGGVKCSFVGLAFLFIY